MQSFFKILAAIALIAVANVRAESHTVTFTNNCGSGTPFLKAGGQTLSTGGAYTSNGPLISAIAYLQTGPCGDNGEGCTLVELTLQNPTSPGAGSAADISLVSPHAFSVTSGFGYYNGCDGQGEDCTGPNCPGAFTNPTNGAIIACQDDNVDISVTFCA